MGLRVILIVSVVLASRVVWAADGPPGAAQAVSSSANQGTGKPWKLSANNWQEGEELLPAPILERVKNKEYEFTVVPTDPEKIHSLYSQKFWDASESNAGKYDIDPDTCGLKDAATGEMPSFYFGYPFPKVDPQDPLAGCKMAWNFDAANHMGNGAGATFTLNGIDGSGEFKRIKMWLHLMSFLGRSAGPTDNPENLRTTDLGNVLEPQDIDGVGGLTKRLNDWHSQDKQWFFVPSTRRIRRINAATRSDPVAGLDIFSDDLNCYGGKIEYYHWKLVGEGKVLAPLIGTEPLRQKKASDTRVDVEIPYLKGAYETPGGKGAPWQIVDHMVMVPRPVWILEGQSDDPYYNFGKVVMYMDKDIYRIWWKLVHNRSGEYFYNAMCVYHFSADETRSFTAVTPSAVIGVNDKTNRACMAGRYSSQFLESNFDDGYFSLSTLTKKAD